MDLQIKGRTALVTGSSRGTGEVIARRLHAEGARVIVHGIDQGSGAALAADLDGLAVSGDIATESGTAEVLAQLAELPAVDILVNNYGSAGRGKWSRSSTEDWLQMYQVNVLSAARLIQALLPILREKGWGRVILLGTIGSARPNAVMPHYYSAKGALPTMARSLMRELAGSGITVNTVSPGLILTREVEQAYRSVASKEGWGDDWDSIEARVVARDFPNAAGRIGRREDIASTVCFLASPQADFINGQDIFVDGGAL